MERKYDFGNTNTGYNVINRSMQSESYFIKISIYIKKTKKYK